MGEIKQRTRERNVSYYCGLEIIEYLKRGCRGED